MRNEMELRKKAYTKIIKILEESKFPYEEVENYSDRLTPEEIYTKLTREQIRTAALVFALMANIPISQSALGPMFNHDLNGLLEDYLLDPKKRDKLNRLRAKWLVNDDIA